ncbi:MAG: hypothetical protein KFF77_09695 [Bacteroidetes bacterium]|nr:hypothetical protein [Bacteroidota bacterium]
MSAVTMLCLLGLLPLHRMAAQESEGSRDFERGIPAIINYNTSANGYDANNFSIIRDSRGVLFIANVDALLEWVDPTYWRWHTTDFDKPLLGQPVFSVGMLANGTVVYGSKKSFGFVTISPDGKLKLESLNNRLPEAQHPTTWVSQIAVIGSVAWFKSDSLLYSWNGKEVGVVAASAAIMYLGEVHGRLYAQVEGVGLMEMVNQRLIPIPKLDALKDPENRVQVFLPAGDRRTLLYTRQSGWLWLEDGTLTPAWTREIRRRLPVEPTCGIVLRDGSYAFGTSRDGIWIVRRDGRISMILDESTGLRDEAVQGLYQDDERILWAALDNGFARIDWPAATTRFGRSSGIKGRITAITRFKGQLYANSTTGTYRLEPEPQASAVPTGVLPRFVEVANTPPEAMDMLDCGDELLLSYAQGVFGYDGRRLRLLLPGSSRVLFPLDARHDSIIVTRVDGMKLLCRDGRSWSSQEFLPGFPALDSVMILSLVRSADQSLWISSLSHGLYRIRIGDGVTKATVKHYPLSTSLPRSATALYQLDGRILVVSDEEDGYILDPSSETFTPASTLYRTMGYPREAAPVSVTRLSDQSLLLELIDSSRWYGIATATATSGMTFERLPALFRQILHSSHADSNGVCWFGGEEYLFRHDLRARQYVPPPSRMLIREVYNADLAFYHGNWPSEETEVTAPFTNYGVTLIYAATRMKYPEQLRYRWKLIGEQDDWGKWTEKTTAEFPGLMEGRYTFIVEGIDTYGDTITQATIRIHITPPMHRTWWAYGLYFLGAAGLFVLALRFRTRRLEQRGRELEATIHERTEKIQEQSEKIRSQAEELETLDSIVRTVNKEVRLTDVLSALLQQTLLLFPDVSTAFYMQRNTEDGLFRLVANVGEPTESLASRAFTLSEIMDDKSNSLQTIQDGVYVLRGVERVWNERMEMHGGASKAFMGMSDMQHGTIRGFLVLGSDTIRPFDADDLRKLLRLREHVSSAVAKALAIRELESKNEQLDQSNRQLREMQQQLIVHEKLAALGELTAGIAHEIQNPLNFVNNFSSLSLELLDELEHDMTSMQREEDAPILGLLSTVRSNCERIREHGMRATSIVRAMLMHTRKGSGRRETVALNEFLDQFVLLSYHGMRMLHPEHDLRLHTEYDRGIVSVHILPQEMSRVIVNICNNAWEAAIERAARDNAQSPEVHVRSEVNGDRVSIVVRDNGDGIPEELHGRIFEPFYTTKRSGNNAGLGLSMSYEIVTQLHQGTLAVRSEVGVYSEFIIDIPRNDTLPST